MSDSKINFDQVKRILLLLYREKPTASNREITAAIHAFCDFSASDDVLSRMRRDADLVKKGVRYCFIVSDKNRIKRKSYAIRQLAVGETFLKYVWSDESILQLTGNKATAYVEKSEKYGNVVGVEKYPKKILIWASISWYGASLPVIFQEGTVDTEAYLYILEKSLLPFLQVNCSAFLQILISPHSSSLSKSMDIFQKTFPRGDAIFVQDAAPAHTSGRTLEWIKEKGIKLAEHPAQSPDINRIEVSSTLSTVLFGEK